MSIKSIVGLITAAGLVVAMGALCVPGTTTSTATPTKAPTATAVATVTAAATPTPNTLGSGVYNFASKNASAASYAAGALPAGQAQLITVIFTPTTGKLVTVSVKASQTLARPSIDVYAGVQTAGSTNAGDGAYSAQGTQNTNTTTFSFTPTSNGTLTVETYEWSVTGGSATVTVTQ